MVDADDAAEVEEEGNTTSGFLAENAEEAVGNCGCRLLGFVIDVVPEEERPVERKAVTNVCDVENANTMDSDAIRSIDFVVGKNIIIVCKLFLCFFFILYYYYFIFLLQLRSYHSRASQLAFVSRRCRRPRSSGPFSMRGSVAVVVVNYYY